MGIDPRTPVIAGVGQLSGRSDDVAASPEPAAMMAQVLQLAQADSRAETSLLERAQSVRTFGVLSWRYPDQSRAVADALTLDPAETLVTTIGGNSPQWVLNLTAAAIQRGELDVCLLAGAEAMYTRGQARKLDVRLPWTPMADRSDQAPVRLLGEDKFGSNEAETMLGLAGPPVMYPLLENALRGAAGRTVAEHTAVIAGLWSRFSEVAASNPYAWLPEPKTAAEIATPSPDNRMIAFPYTKLMNANLQVDQAAGFILCSYEAARAAGVPDDRLVFPVAGADANDVWYVSDRRTLHESPAIAACGRAALSAAGLGIDDVAHVDLYSCFPAAVEIGAAALGLALDDPSRPLTLTGGLTFAGGPGNNYVSHSIATLVGRLRENPDDVGLVTGLGWYVTKHSIGVYRARPVEGGFRGADVQAEVDALDARRPFVPASSVEGPVRVETYTVTYERDGTPVTGIVACLLPDGSRTLATTSDPADLADLTSAECLDRTAVIRGGGLTLHLE